MEDQKFLIESLEEAVELLQDEITRVRKTNKVLRIVNGGLRRRLAFAAQNDQAFKDFCATDITTDADDEGGLPDSTPSQS